LSYSKLESRVAEIIEPVLTADDYELVDLEYKKEGPHWVLRLYIDHPHGINLDDCETVSHKVSARLDTTDPIPHSYLLEVSSPGLERPLKKDADFQRFTGKMVLIKTFHPIGGKKLFRGKLGGLREQGVLIWENDQEVIIPQGAISSAHLEIEF